VPVRVRDAVFGNLYLTEKAGGEVRVRKVAELAPEEAIRPGSTGLPVPGYAAPADTTVAGTRASFALLSVVRDAAASRALVATVPVALFREPPSPAPPAPHRGEPALPTSGRTPRSARRRSAANSRRCRGRFPRPAPA